MKHYVSQWGRLLILLSAFFFLALQTGFAQKASVSDTFKYEILLDAPDKTPQFFLGIDYLGFETDLEREAGDVGFGLDLNYFPSPRSWIKANGFMSYVPSIPKIVSEIPLNIDFPRFRTLDLLHTWYFAVTPKKKRGSSNLGMLAGGAYNTRYYFTFDFTKSIRYGLRTGLFNYNFWLGLSPDDPISALSDGTHIYMHGFTATSLTIGLSRAKAQNYVVRNGITGVDRSIKFRHWYADLLLNVSNTNGFSTRDSTTSGYDQIEVDLDVPVIRAGFRIGYESMIKLPKMDFGGLHVNWEYSIRPRPAFRTISPLEDAPIRFYSGHASVKFGFYLYAPENF